MRILESANLYIFDENAKVSQKICIKSCFIFEQMINNIVDIRQN